MNEKSLITTIVTITPKYEIRRHGGDAAGATRHDGR
jgi:hypothetical protein